MVSFVLDVELARKIPPVSVVTFVPVLPTLIVSTRELALTTIAWLATSVPGFRPPAIGTTASCIPMNKTLLAAENASSPLANEPGVAVLSLLLI